MTQRYIVSQLLNTWAVRDRELLKVKKRSIVYETDNESDAAVVCAACNEGKVPTDVLNYHPSRHKA